MLSLVLAAVEIDKPLPPSFAKAQTSSQRTMAPIGLSISTDGLGFPSSYRPFRVSHSLRLPRSIFYRVHLALGGLAVKGRIVLGLSIGLLAANFALAEGFYAGGGLGVVQIEDSEAGLSFEDSTFGLRLLAGFDVNDYFAIEGSYIATDTAEDSVQGVDIEVELSAFVVSFLGLIPVGDSTSLFGKLGYYSGEQEATAFGITIDEDEDGVTAGAGVRFDIANNLTIRGDFDWFDTDLDTLWSVGVGVQYQFGN